MHCFCREDVSSILTLAVTPNDCIDEAELDLMFLKETKRFQTILIGVGTLSALAVSSVSGATGMSSCTSITTFVSSQKLLSRHDHVALATHS